ncbi:hypothetical protein OG883_08100 [Streptomyces sp. NBC_01142]|uniref:hypothetical protein n=1 Tax=Streptomyces sp. NBC_01142 TaxID=2975865 RepID=UPI00224F66C0|nr:hypothetical protein [Streptomyces sp. NBC_01142]MCX4819865.1 hypothetical protein [Streptomyces sp. NBC_01142]
MGKQGLEMHQKPDGTTKLQEPEKKRLDLSLPQVAGSALAAIAAAVLASRLGVYGTIIGAGVVSVVATCGGSVFQHFFRRTGEQIRDVTVQAKPKPKGRQVQVQVPMAGAGQEFGEATTHGTRVRGWKRPVIAAAVVFGVTMIGVTGYELASGSDLSGGKGTTLTSVVRGGGGKFQPPATPSQTPGHDREQDRKQNGEESQEQGQDQDQQREQEQEQPPGTGSGRSPDTGSDPDSDTGSTDPAPDPSTSTGGDPSKPPSTPAPAPSGSTGGSAPDTPSP